jgi:hypothetical protein
MGRFLLFLTSLVLSVVLVEVLLRVFFSEQLFLDERFMSPNAHVHHDYIPDVIFRRSPSPGETFHPVVVRINSFGMRGPLPGPKERYRVLNVGDSFVEAPQVEFEETFGERLNAAFRGRIEFLSHGMSSWAPTTEFSWIHHKGLQLKPDEVILFLCGNDFFRASVYKSADASYRQQATYEGRVPVGYRLDTLPGLERARRGLAITRLMIRARSGARQLLRGRDGKATPKRGPATDDSAIGREYALLGEPRESWPPELRAAIEGTVQVIRDLDDYLRERKVRLSVLIAPSGFAWKDECALARPSYGWTPDMAASQSGLETFLKEALAADHIPFIDLRQAFEEAKRRSPGQLLYNEADCHWNRQGHAVVFECLNAYLQDRAADGPSGAGARLVGQNAH